MKCRCLLMASIGLLPMCALARLGEKLPELIDRYGQPVLETTIPSYEFKSGNLQIIVLLGKSGQTQSTQQGGESVENCSIEEQIRISGGTLSDAALNEILVTNGIDDGKIVKGATRELRSKKSKDGTRLAEFNMDSISVKMVGLAFKKQNATGY